MLSSTGSDQAFKPSGSGLTSKGYYWKIVSFIPSEVLNQRATTILLHWLPFYGLFIIFLSLVSWYFALTASRRRRAEEERERLIKRLQETLAEVKTLSGMLPICANCKKIRDDKGYWNQIEAYIGDHSEAEFSHGICPDCAKKLYPEFYKGD